MIATKFQLGQIVATPGALRLMDETGVNPLLFIARHKACDWGEMTDDDKRMNNDALTHGGRIFSAYRIDKRTKLWVITEADRSSTCILLPEEY